MELINLLVRNPVVIISLIIVVVFKIFPPKKMNSWYGYRTLKSMENVKKWEIAQKYSANLSLVALSILLFVQILIYVCFNSNIISDFAVIVLWGIGMGMVIYKTERMLKDL